jgi:hypothetical protein
VGKEKEKEEAKEGTKSSWAGPFPRGPSLSPSLLFPSRVGRPRPAAGPAPGRALSSFSLADARAPPVGALFPRLSRARSDLSPSVWLTLPGRSPVLPLFSSFPGAQRPPELAAVILASPAWNPARPDPLSLL